MALLILEGNLFSLHYHILISFHSYLEPHIMCPTDSVFNSSADVNSKLSR